MILVLDNFDSFTYNLVDYFKQLGIVCKVFRNNASLYEIKKFNYDAIVLSPGPGRPENSGSLMEVIDEYHSKLPILGICLGHQALGQYFGAEIVKAEKPMHGKVASIKLFDALLFKGLPSEISVVRYHSLMLSDLSPCLEMVAESITGTIMAIKHKSLSIYGLQFHPEAIMTEYGLEMLGNWLIFNSIKSLNDS